MVGGTNLDLFMMRVAKIPRGIVESTTYIYFYFRIEEEEKLLAHDTRYREYKKLVRYRLIPLMY